MSATVLRSRANDDGSRTEFYLDDGTYKVYASIGDTEMARILRDAPGTTYYYAFVGGQQIGFERTLDAALAVVERDRRGAPRALYGYYGGE